MLRQMVLPDNVAPPIFSQIFVGADTKIYDQHIFGWSRHIMWQKKADGPQGGANAEAKGSAR